MVFAIGFAPRIVFVRASAATAKKSVASVTKGAKSAAKPVAKSKGRSGGVVDAPGKKHRKPVPNEPLRVNAADRARVAKTKVVNTNRKRGR